MIVGVPDRRALAAALNDVLACPRCGSGLEDSDSHNAIRCGVCRTEYPIEDGIVSLFVASGADAQVDERRLRDDVMIAHRAHERQQILDVVAEHHCVSVMAERARGFRASVDPQTWVLDLGAGAGWCWSRTVGARLVLVDFSLEALRAARQLLSDGEGAVLVWADARRLPLRNASIAGLWSVQVLQHLPDEAFRRVQAELDRVLSARFIAEIYTLNPAWAHRVVYRLTGRRYHRRGRLDALELNRLSARELAAAWADFRAGRARLRSGYSELFFHPNFHLRPRHYPVALERAIAAAAPRLASLFARQVHVRLEGEPC